MSFESFLVIIITVMVSVIGYFLVKKDNEEKEWRKRTEEKIDEMHERIMGNLESYLLREPHLETHRVVKERLDEHTVRLTALENAVFRGRYGERNQSA